MNICHCDWFNKEVDWPIAGQDIIRWKSHTENVRKKKCRGNKICWRTGKAMSHVAEHRLIEMG